MFRALRDRALGSPAAPSARAPNQVARWTAIGTVFGLVAFGGLQLVRAAFTAQSTTSGSTSTAQCFYVPTVQSGSVISTGNGTTTVPISTVDPTRAFVMFSATSAGTRPTAGSIGATIASSTSLGFVRVSDNVTPEPVAVTITWSVVEYPCGISVQRGTASISAATTNVTITSVGATTQAFATVSSTGGASDQTWVANGDDLLSARLTTATNLQLQSAVAPGTAHTAYWQVVAFTDATMINVQSGTTTLGTGTASSTVNLATSAPTGSSFVLASTQAGVSGNTTDIASALVRVTQTNATQLTVDRSASASPATVAWQVVTLSDGTTVQSGTSTLAAGTSSGSPTISAVTLNRVSAFATVMTAAGINGGQTGHQAGDDVGIATSTFEPSSSTSLGIDRSTTTTAASFTWQVIDWGRRATSTATASAPAAPTGLTGGGLPSSSLRIGWTTPLVATGAPVTDYSIQWRTSPSGTWTAVADATSSTTNATITGLTNGTTYDVRVAATNSNGTGSWSSPVTITLASAPGAPTALTATAGNTQVGLSWSAPASSGGSAVTDYLVEYSSNGGTTWTTFNDGTSTATTATVTGLTNSTTYTFRVSATNTFGTGASSSTASATPAGTPGAPSGVSASRLSLSVLAGSGSAGSTDATGAAASFNRALDGAVDSAGNLYIADLNNNKIRKITPAGVVTTFAGSGAAGGTNGTGTAATFSGPHGLVFDSSGNLYVAEYGSPRIRKITPAGVVTTFAGSGNTGSSNGTGTNASFNQPVRIAIDSNDNLYVADRGNNKIRKITPAGVVTTFAGSGTASSTDGTGTNATFNAPQGLAFDPAGNLFVAEYSGRKIRKITAAGVVTTFAGSGSAGSADGTGTAASFQTPTGLTADPAGNLYLADFANNKIRKITPAAVVTSVAGSGSPGTNIGTTTRSVMNGPYGIVRDSAGNIDVLEDTGARIDQISPSGSGRLDVAWVQTSGNGGSAITDFLVEYRTSPSGSWATFPDGTSTTPSSTITGLTNGTAYDIRVSAINAIGTGTASSTVTATPGVGPDAPTAVTLTPTSGQLAVSWTAPTNTGGSAVTDYVVEYRTSPSGSWIAFNDGTSTTPSATITGLANGTAYDVRVSALNTYDLGTASSTATATPGTPPGAPTGVAASRLALSALAGSGSSGSANGTGTAATFNGPRAVAIDSTGNVFVADFANNQIRKITPAGVVTTFAGSGTAGGTNGTGTAATFNGPWGVAIDGSDNLYVSEQSGHRIRKITPAGVVTTFAGSGSNGSTNATGTAASFNGPSGLTFDGSGNLYVADYSNGLVRKVTTTGVVTTYASVNRATALTFDASGNLYVAAGQDDAIRKVTPGGVVSTFVGAGSSGFQDATGTSARFNNPQGIVADPAGNLYVADTGNLRIRKVTPAGVVTTIAGSGTSGTATGVAAGDVFASPIGITRATDGTLIVGDSTNHRITTLQASSGSLAVSWTAPSSSGTSAITDYLVEYRTSPSGSWTTFADGTSTATSATITGLTVGTAYDVRISATNATATGTTSSTATATPASAPGAPTAVNVTPSSGQLAVSWTAPASNGGAAISDYTIEYRTSTTGIWKVFPDGTSTATSTTITGLTNGTAYDVRVAAVNTYDVGSPSATTTSTPATFVAPQPRRPDDPLAPTLSLLLVVLLQLCGACGVLQPFDRRELVIA